MTTLADLTVVKARDDVLTEELTNAQGLGLATTAWQSGSVVRTIFTVVAQSIANFSTVIVEAIRGGFGDLLSSLQWGTVWAKQTYNVDAVQALPATGYITAVNSSNNIYGPYAPGGLIVAHSVTGQTYVNTQPVTIAANATTTPITIQSTQVGTIANAAPTLISKVVSPTMTGVTVSNPLSVFGADAETLAALVARARSLLGQLSPNGPKDAYNYVAKTPSFAAVSTPITRSLTVANPTTGAVTVYVATANGAPISADVALVQAASDNNAEPWCTLATVVAVGTVTVPVTYSVWCKTTLQAADIQTAIASAITTYFANLPIGGTILSVGGSGFLYMNNLILAISNATTANGTSLGIVRCTLSLPASDVALANNQVAVLGTITPTVNFL